MFSVGSAVKEALSGLGLYKKYQQHKVWEVWDKVVGPRIASVAQPERFNFDTLFVAVSDSMWLHHLNCLQQEMMDKLNGALGKEGIKRIYFRLGKPSHVGSSRPAAHQKPSLPELDPQELDAIDQTLNPLKDEESRALLKSIMVKSAALVKKGQNR